MQAMEWRDWIDLGQLMAIVGIGTCFAIRLEKLRKLYARNLKRYDLLHTARFKAMEVADDSLVEVQQAQFEVWKALNDGSTSEDGSPGNADLMMKQLRKATHGAAIAKVKCEKYFEKDFNDEFAALMGTIQTAEMRLDDVHRLPDLFNADELGPSARANMEKAYITSRDAIPVFRKRMGEIIQKGIDK